MNSPESQIIVKRFFEALDTIIEAGVLRGRRTFTERYGINRWNLYTLKENPERDIFQPGWLTPLVKDFHVSARWILTGEGDFYQEGWTHELVRLAIDYEKEKANGCK